MTTSARVPARERANAGTARRRLAAFARHSLFPVPCSLLLLASGCIRQQDQTGERAGGQTNARDADRFPVHHLFSAATSVAAAVDEDGQWTMAAKDYASTRYSGLDEIRADNAGRLRLAWTFSDGNPFGHEGAPLVVGGTMYIVSPFPHQVFALDLTRPGAPQKWRYAPPYQRAAPGVSCCGRVNRGPAYADGRLYFNTLDNQVVALEAATGAEAWRVRVGDINQGQTMTMAPLVVKGKVIVGNSGGEFGVRGWLMALDAATGSTVWKAYATGPDEDVLIGPGFRPFYPGDR